MKIMLRTTCPPMMNDKPFGNQPPNTWPSKALYVAMEPLVFVTLKSVNLFTKWIRQSIMKAGNLLSVKYSKKLFYCAGTYNRTYLLKKYHSNKDL